jgi:L-ascorbate metabolism protein UlaG (beta-lactamase superfamily)
MDPDRAAESLTHLKPKMAVPIHWGTYYPMILDWFQPNFLNAPPEEFARRAAEVAPDVLVQIVNPGDSFEVSDFDDVDAVSNNQYESY